jgi:NADH-quinone oxidoreductase subunit F
VDLHIVGAEPTDEERQAVDCWLGAPETGWDGGTHDADRDGRTARGGLDARSRRDRLLPALHAVQDAIGWISHGALNYVCRRLSVPPAEAWGVVTFYHLLSVRPAPRTVVHVCDDIACRARGAMRICGDLERAWGPAVGHGVHRADRQTGSGHAPASLPARGWQPSPCLGHCEQAPAALLLSAGASPVRVEIAPVPDLAALEARVRAAVEGEAVTPSTDEVLEGLRAVTPQAGSPALRILRRVGVVDPGSLDAYRASGGYGALSRAFTLGPGRVIAEVVASKLMGRGGAAFPTGRKWEAVAREPATPRYVVCNADESEPGTFKDRILMSGDPFAIVEAMTICGFATGAERGYVYVRGEYPESESRMATAIAAAYEVGLLGADVMGRGVRFDLEVRRGAGAYICGEETALFNSIEGKRGEPRSKPPFPSQVGLFGRPTVVNNVETLANIPDIVIEGGEAWARVGTEASTGPKLFCVSGHVARPGLYEVPFGATLGEVVALAGGVAGSGRLQAVLLGGAAGAFVGPDALDMPLTFEGARAAHATLGSGVVLVFDDTVDLVEMLRRIAQFFRDESCGQCVPCRVGTVRQEELLARARSAGNGRGSLSADDLVLLNELGQAMRDASICGLGQTASSAIETAVARLAPFGGTR